MTQARTSLRPLAPATARSSSGGFGRGSRFQSARMESAKYKNVVLNASWGVKVIPLAVHKLKMRELTLHGFLQPPESIL